MDALLRQYIINLATKLIGTPYVWGGEKPYIGLDCSGYVIFILQVFEILSNGDWTAAALSKIYERTKTPLPGDLAFYGSDDSHITHVAVVLNSKNAISAHGAGRNATRESSLKKGAGVGIHSIYYRNDFRFFGDISKPEEL